MKCLICNIKVKSLNGLAQHLRFHKDITPKEYYLKYLIKIPIDTQCPYCKEEKEFEGLYGFNTTCGNPICVQKSHNEKTTETVKQKRIKNGTYLEKKYPCPYCEKKFSYAKSICVHIGKKHKDISAEQYYLQHINPTVDPLCPYCKTKNRILQNGGKMGYMATCGNTRCISECRYDSLKEQGTFIKSHSADYIYDFLKNIFPDIQREHRDRKRYKLYWADFYVPSKDLFIEYQGYWTHGDEPFNKDNSLHIQILTDWKGKAKTIKSYVDAIDVWTRRDPEKRILAKQHGFTLLEIWKGESDEKIFAKIKELDLLDKLQ